MFDSQLWSYTESIAEETREYFDLFLSQMTRPEITNPVRLISYQVVFDIENKKIVCSMLLKA